MSNKSFGVFKILLWALLALNFAITVFVLAFGITIWSGVNIPSTGFLVLVLVAFGANIALAFWLFTSLFRHK